MREAKKGVLGALLPQKRDLIIISQIKKKGWISLLRIFGAPNGTDKRSQVDGFERSFPHTINKNLSQFMALSAKEGLISGMNPLFQMHPNTSPERRHTFKSDCIALSLGS